jgi:hypothetical protein
MGGDEGRAVLPRGVSLIGTHILKLTLRVRGEKQGGEAGKHGSGNLQAAA